MATANTEIGVKINVDGKGAETAVGSIKKQLKEATASLIEMRDKFGDTSKEAVEAAKKVANLKDAIGDAKSMADAFNPDAKFKALSGALSSVAGGFAAVQGAQALFGSESKELEATLVKVQGAMALSQGINSILEAKDSFKNLKTVAVDSFNAIKTAIGSTGIGLLVVALGLLVANWDKISAAIRTTTKEQENLNKTTEDYKKGTQDAIESVNKVTSAFNLAKKGVISKEQALKTYNETLGATFGKTNDLNVAEQRIVAGAKAYIKMTGLKQQATALYALAAEESAKSITAGMQDEVTTFDKVLIAAKAAINPFVNTSAEVVKKQISNTEKIKKTSKEAADLILKQADDLSAQAETIANDNKFQNEDEAKAADEQAAKLLEKQKAYREKVLATNKQYSEEEKKLERENYLASITDIEERSKEKLRLDFEDRKKEIENSVASETIKNNLLQELGKKYWSDLAIIDKDAADKKKEKLKKDNEDLYAEMIAEFDKEAAARQKSLLDQAALDLTNSANVKLSFDERLAAVLDREQKEKDIVFASQEERTAYEKANADARIAIGEAEAEAKKTQLTQISSALSSLAELAGKETAAGKGLAVAAATISTYQNAVAAYSSAFKPVPTQASPVLGAVYAGIAVAQGIANVKKILSVKVPNGGGGGTAPSPVSIPNAPLAPQLQTTSLNQGQINQLSSATTRAFVLESDVSGNQERITRLNRASRIN